MSKSRPCLLTCLYIVIYGITHKVSCVINSYRKTVHQRRNLLQNAPTNNLRRKSKYFFASFDVNSWVWMALVSKSKTFHLKSLLHVKLSTFMLRISSMKNIWKFESAKADHCPLVLFRLRLEIHWGRWLLEQRVHSDIRECRLNTTLHFMHDSSPYFWPTACEDYCYYDNCSDSRVVFVTDQCNYMKMLRESVILRWFCNIAREEWFSSFTLQSGMLWIRSTCNCTPISYQNHSPWITDNLRIFKCNSNSSNETTHALHRFISQSCQCSLETQPVVLLRMPRYERGCYWEFSASNYRNS